MTVIVRDLSDPEGGRVQAKHAFRRFDNRANDFVQRDIYDPSMPLATLLGLVVEIDALDDRRATTYHRTKPFDQPSSCAHRSPDRPVVRNIYC